MEEKKLSEFGELYLEVIKRSFDECAQYYPKYLDRVFFLAMEYLKCMVNPTKENSIIHKRIFHYLYEFSNYIAKKYFPNEINEDWRRPIALEHGINNLMIKRLSKSMDENPKIKDDLISDLQSEPTLKGNPLVSLMEASLIGIPIDSIELSNALEKS